MVIKDPKIPRKILPLKCKEIRVGAQTVVRPGKRYVFSPNGVEPTPIIRSFISVATSGEVIA